MYKMAVKMQFGDPELKQQALKEIAPTAAATLKSCAKCNKTEQVLKEFSLCSQCRQVHYCGRDCQVADWKAHKKFCKEHQVKK